MAPPFPFLGRRPVKDPYGVLGVARGATADEIKQAYRVLARELHPDLNPGDRRAEDRFKEVSAAYDFLSDADRRARFDRGEIDATGASLRRRPAQEAKSEAKAGRARRGFGFADSADDILEELLRRRDRARAREAAEDPRAAGGGDIRQTVAVGFVEAATGVTRRVSLESGKTLEVRIPAGAVDGQVLRLKGQGHPSMTGDGDAYIEVKVAADPVFSRRERDILVELDVSLQEAVLGAKVQVPTIEGPVALTVPPNSNSGTVLRLRGRGIAATAGRGDQLVTLRVMLPENDSDFRKFVEKWGPKHPYDPRQRKR
jgi:DnaJ-class molecular chaperone